MCVCVCVWEGGLNVLSCWADILGTKWGRRQKMGWGRKEKKCVCVCGGGGDKMGWGWGALFLFGVVVVDGGWGGGEKTRLPRTIKIQVDEYLRLALSTSVASFHSSLFLFFKHLPPPPHRPPHPPALGPFCFTSTEARWLIMDGDGGGGVGWGGGDKRAKARAWIPHEKDRRDRGPPPEQWKC